MKISYYLTYLVFVYSLQNLKFFHLNSLESSIFTIFFILVKQFFFPFLIFYEFYYNGQIKHTESLNEFLEFHIVIKTV